MDFKGLTSTQFADTVDVPRAVISHILSGRNKPSLEVVTKIVMAYPDISMNWILLGEGTMLKELAAVVAPENEAEQKVDAPAGYHEKAPLQITEDDKVQNTPVPDATSFIASNTGKTIEQIVIFYTDKTFTAYKP